MPAADPAPGNARREARRRCAAVLLTWRVDVRGIGSEARSFEVALSDRRVQARFDLDQGRPSAPADPSQLEALEGRLPKARLCRARVRQAEEPMGLEASAGQRLRSGSAPCRLDDPHEVGLRAVAGAGHYGSAPSAARKPPRFISPGSHTSPVSSSAGVISSDPASLTRVSILGTRKPRSIWLISVLWSEARTLKSSWERSEL